MALEDRVKTLEQWREQEGINYDVKVKLAESWVKDYIDLKSRIEALEEWQSNVKEFKEWNVSPGSHIIIDKRVWQRIKNVVACKPYWYDGGMHNAVHDRLIQLIKQVDPEWNP